MKEKIGIRAEVVEGKPHEIEIFTRFSLRKSFLDVLCETIGVEHVDYRRYDAKISIGKLFDKHSVLAELKKNIANYLKKNSLENQKPKPLIKDFKPPSLEELDALEDKGDVESFVKKEVETMYSGHTAEDLKALLDKSVNKEDYETAAFVRDELKSRGIKL